MVHKLLIAPILKKSVALYGTKIVLGIEFCKFKWSDIVILSKTNPAHTMQFHFCKIHS